MGDAVAGAAAASPTAQLPSGIIDNDQQVEESADSESKSDGLDTLPPPVTAEGACSSSILQPLSMPVMNSLVSRNQVVVEQAVIDSVVPDVPAVPAASAAVDGEDATMISASAPLMSSAAQPGSAIATNTNTVPILSVATANGAEMVAGKAPTPVSHQPIAPPVPALLSAALAQKQQPQLQPQAAAKSLTSSSSVSSVVGASTGALPGPPPAPLIASSVPVAENVLPGPTYLEPMDTEAAASGQDDGCVVKKAAATLATAAAGSTVPSVTDVNMESATNPPTPASGIMQVRKTFASHLKFLRTTFNLYNAGGGRAFLLPSQG